MTESVVLANELAVTVDGSGASKEIVSGEGAFYLDVTAASGTAPTLDVDVEEQDLVSGKWFSVLSFAQASAVTQERLISPSPANNGAPAPGGLPGRRYRVSWVVGGTTPSFDFRVGFAGPGR